MASGSSFAFFSSLEFRVPNGAGNNNGLGLAGGLYDRVTLNSYLGDGVTMDNSGPVPRAISNQVLAQPQQGGVDIDLPNAAGTNEFFQFFGQFLTHDITEAFGGGPPDTPIALEGIPNFIPFFRTPSIMVNDVREQRTSETSFLDLSTVYGVRADMLAMLRVGADSGAQGAKLLTGVDNLLPTFQNVSDDSGVDIAVVREVNNGVTALGGFAPSLFVSGDDRTNQSAALISQHVVWMREHNYQVDRLSALYPNLTQDQLFNAARAVTEAEWQNVVYSEYLTKLVGQNAIKAYSGFKASVDPSVINEFATVAFRFGHDQSSNAFDILAENGASTGAFTLGQSFLLANASEAIRNSGSMDEWVRGQLAHTTQEIDGKIVDGNRNLLFGGGSGQVIDLEVFDIQRGRDHGVGNYDKLRQGLGLSTYSSFEQFAAENGIDAATLDALRGVYSNDITKLDAIVGGLLEKNFAGSMLGETFTRLIVTQFENLRDGDRLYYETRLAGAPELIAEIKSTTFADILARTTGIDHIYHDAFAAHTRIGGSEAAESLVGTGAKDLIFGQGGDDVASGDAGEDDLYGEGGDDRLEGGAGADRIHGGAGNDTASYASSSAVTVDITTGLATGDQATGDTLTDIENLTGGTGADNLRGNSGANRLLGGAGDDVLRGEGGNDHLGGGGGNDHLVGGSGQNTMLGGAGDDTYRVDSAADAIYETSGEGSDTVVTSVSYALSAFVENLLAADGTSGLSLYGNELANTLTGNDGANALIGGGGADVLVGKNGDDVYYADAFDSIVEQVGGGFDTIVSETSIALAANVENLVVTGVSGGRSVGNAAANHLTGGSGRDLLSGGLGRDLLYGGGGNDVFIFDTKARLTRANVDKIVDYNVKEDSLWFDNGHFARLGKAGSEANPKKIDKNFFVVGDKAQDGNDYLIYNPKTGMLFYDKDGSGQGSAIAVASLSKNLKMTFHDFFVI